MMMRTTLDRSTLAEAVRAFLSVIEKTPETAPAPEPRRGRPRAVDPQSEPVPPSPWPVPKLLTFKELQAVYKISRPAAYVLINEGKLERVKIGKRALITDTSARALMTRG
jgi:hypothetical protein